MRPRRLRITMTASFNRSKAIRAPPGWTGEILVESAGRWIDQQHEDDLLPGWLRFPVQPVLPFRDRDLADSAGPGSGNGLSSQQRRNLVFPTLHALIERHHDQGIGRSERSHRGHANAGGIVPACEVVYPRLMRLASEPPNPSSGGVRSLLIYLFLSVRGCCC